MDIEIVDENTTQVAPLPTQRRPARQWALLAALAGGLLLALWWFDPSQLRVPLCGLYATTGLCCPGCGATRATHELLQGRLLEALHQNALWVLGLPLAVYVAVSELRCSFGGRPLPGNLARRPWFLIAAAAAVLTFFVLRNLPCHPFTLLAPPG